MGLLDQHTIALSLFDIFRGIFTHEEMRVKSSGVTSEVQASAKLSLLAFLLENAAAQAATKASEDVSLKAFLGDLVIGIHNEINRD